MGNAGGFTNNPPVPPDGHKRRCQGKSTQHGGQCKNWALKGKNKCRFHGGRSGSNSKSKAADNMPRFYGRHLGPTLLASLQSQLEADPSEVLNLFEELALMRERAAVSVRLFGAALENGSEDTQHAAAQLMAGHLKDVADMCKTAAQVRSSLDDKFDVSHLQVVVNQICVLINDEVGDSDIARRLNQKLKEQIRLPVSDGTAPTPAEVAKDVAKMDGMFTDG